MRSLLLYLLWFTCHAASSQDIVNFSITQQHGLPSNTVYDVFQDRDGFLWVATENGLARYNGKSFRTYENPAIRSRALGGLFQDSNGRIWCHNFFGEILFVENDSLKKLNTWDQYFDEGIPIISNLGDRFLISTRKQIYYYYHASGKWENLNGLFQEEGALSILNHQIDPHGFAWVSYSLSSKSFVKRLDNRTFFNYEITSHQKPVNSMLTYLIPWQDELLLFDAQNKKLFGLSPDKTHELTEPFQPVLQNTRQVKNLGDSLLCFLSNSGLQVLDTQHHWRSFLKGKNISSVMVDEERGFWVGTLNEGLFYFPFQNTFLHAKQNVGLFTRLAVDMKGKRIFAGGYDGAIEAFSFDGMKLYSLPSDNTREVQSLFVDTVTNQLVTFTDKLYFYDLNTRQKIQTIPGVATKKIVRAHDQLALATSAGLVLVNETATRQIVSSFGNQRLSSLVYDINRQILWVGTQKGVYTYNIQLKVTERWPPNKNLFSPGISDCLVAADYVLLGTQTDGLYILKGNAQPLHLTVADGLISNAIKALDFSNNTVWVGTDKGICSVNLDTNEIQRLDETKGLAAREIFDLKIVGTKLWVSHAAGLQWFEAISLKNTVKPKVHINQVTNNGLLVLNPQQGIELQPSARQLSIEFDVSNNLRSRGFTKILYRIKELGKGWTETTLQNPVANYLLLPYGKLTFEVMAQNEDGMASSNSIVIPINVLAPFWKKPWFIVLCLVIFFFLVGYIFYKRFEKINEHNKARLVQQNQEQELRIAQLTSIRAQMNPHFIFNTMAFIQSKILHGLKEEANLQIQNFSILIRKVLDFSSKEMISLQEEVEVLEKYLAIEKDRFDGSLHYSIEMGSALQNEPLRIPSLITQPFVENALRHGLMHRQGQKRLLIRFTIEDDFLKITIEDNGIGRKASAEFNKARRSGHQSFALEAYRKRIDLLNGVHVNKIDLEILDLYNDHGLASGTQVIITLPTEYEPATKH